MAETGWLGNAEVPAAEAEDRCEAGLVAQIAAGNVEGPVAELYRRYGRRLYRFGMRALRNEGLAEEMVQECFVRLWRTAGQYDPRRARVGTYLFVIARSVALDLRKRSSSRELLLWVPKTCATWPDALRAVGRSATRPAHARPVLACPSVG